MRLTRSISPVGDWTTRSERAGSRRMSWKAAAAAAAWYFLWVRFGKKKSALETVASGRDLDVRRPCDGDCTLRPTLLLVEGKRMPTRHHRPLVRKIIPLALHKRIFVLAGRERVRDGVLDVRLRTRPAGQFCKVSKRRTQANTRTWLPAKSSLPSMCRFWRVREESVERT